MSILKAIGVTVKGFVKMDVHKESTERTPIISEEMNEIRARQSQIQSRLKVLEIESELVKRNVRK